MAEIDVKKGQSQTSQGSAIQTSGQNQQSGGLTRWGSYFPSLFSLSPREFFNMSPFELMRRLTDEMDRAFEHFSLLGGYGTREPSVWTPAVEVFEKDGNLIVRAELPGLTKEDIKVEITDDGLVIQGERKQEHEEQHEGFYRSERSYGRFYRLISLPEGANAEQARANLNNGVLEIAVPVPETQRRRRQIPVEVASTDQPQAASAGQSRS